MTGKGIPFIVVRESSDKIKSVISHAVITGLDTAWFHNFIWKLGKYIGRGYVVRYRN